jgi:hypothetical protein
VVDYNKNDSSKKIVVEVQTGQDKNFYIGFNRAVSFNSGTREAANQVVIVQAEAGYSPSNLYAKLGVNEQRTLVSNYKGQGRDLIARFRGFSSHEIKDAVVDVFFSDCDPQNGCGAPTKAPTKLPTPAPTPQPTGGSSKTGQCTDNRATLVVEVKTDEYGDLDNSWKVLRQDGNLLAGSRPSFPRRNDLYKDGICLQRGQTYDFILDDSYGDAICCKYGQGYYKGYLDGNLIFSGGEGFKFKAKHTFTVV